MHSLALLLFAAAFAHTIASILRVSSVPIFIVSGIFLKISGILPADEELRHTLLLGLTFLVFIAGTELNPNRIGKQFPTAIKVGILQFLCLGLSSYAIAYLSGLGFLPSLYIGLAIAASSTLVIVRILQQRRQIFEPFGRLVLGVLLVQDTIAIAFIALLSTENFQANEILVNIGSLLGLAILSLYFQKKIAPYLFVSLKLDEETLLLLSLATLFSFSFLAHITGLPFVVGAFLGGFALSAFPIHGIVQSQLLSLSDFFVAIFFVALGTTLTLISSQAFVLALIMILLVTTLTPLLVVLIAERAKLSTRGGFEAGLLLAQTSEFSLIIGLIGFEAGHIDEQLLSLIALVTVTTMILTPLLATNNVTWKLTRIRPYPRFNAADSIPENHILMLGCGESGIELLSKLDSEILSRILVVDHDPGVLRALKDKGILVARGDAADFRVLNACKAQNADLIISTISKFHDNQGILKFLKGKSVIVRVAEDHEARIVEKLGGKSVLASKLAAEDVLSWIRNDSSLTQRKV